jgi:hypothetical protein
MTMGNLPNMQNIQQLIDSVLLEKESLKSTRHRSGKWSPSQFGKCYLAQYWHRKNEPISNPIPVRTLRKFAVGKIFHDFVEGLLPEHLTEVKVETDDILGFADIVLDDCVIDIKSAHTNDFRRFWSKDYDIYKGKSTNWLQVATYAKLLNKSWCGLFFIGKDDLCVEQYVAKTSQFEKDIETELEILRAYWRKGELPKAEPRAYNGKECGYCSYKDKCGVKDEVPNAGKQVLQHKNSKNG